MAVDRDAGYDAVEALCGGSGSEHVWSITGSGGFALERQLQWLKELLPGGLFLVPHRLAIPDGIVAREGVGLEEHVRRESGEHVVCDW